MTQRNKCVILLVQHGGNTYKLQESGQWVYIDEDNSMVSPTTKENDLTKTEETRKVVESMVDGLNDHEIEGMGALKYYLAPKINENDLLILKIESNLNIIFTYITIMGVVVFWVGLVTSLVDFSS